MEMIHCVPLVGKMKTIIGDHFGHLKKSSGVPFPSGARMGVGGLVSYEERLFLAVCGANNNDFHCIGCLCVGRVQSNGRRTHVRKKRRSRKKDGRMRRSRPLYKMRKNRRDMRIRSRRRRRNERNRISRKRRKITIIKLVIIIIIIIILIIILLLLLLIIIIIIHL